MIIGSVVGYEAIVGAAAAISALGGLIESHRNNHNEYQLNGGDNQQSAFEDMEELERANH
jgi:hypothetical protein